MFVIRKMRQEDISKIAVMEQNIFSDPWSERSIAETWGQKHTLILAALENHQLIGYVILYLVLEEGEIARIAVDESFRRKGVASRILQEMESFCQENGVQRILLDVRESNEAARAFYERHGFEVDGVRKNYYSNPTEHAVLMSCQIGK